MHLRTTIERKIISGDSAINSYINQLKKDVRVETYKEYHDTMRLLYNQVKQLNRKSPNRLKKKRLLINHKINQMKIEIIHC